MVLFPAGHSRNNTADLQQLLHHKFRLLGRLALPDTKVEETIQRLLRLETATAEEVQQLYAIEGLAQREPVDC